MLKKTLKFRAISVISLVAALIVSYFAFEGLFQLKLDYEFEKFFPKNDAETNYFESYRKVFGSDNDFLLIGLKNNEGVFKQDFLSKVNLLSKKIQKGPFINEVTSPTNLKQPIIDPLFGTLFKKPVLRYSQPEFYAIDSAQIFSDPLLMGNYFSSNNQAVVLFVKTDEYLSKVKCDSLSKFIYQTLENFNFDETYVGGRSVGQIRYIDLIQTELIKFILTSFILVITFLIITYKSIWGVVIPFIIITLSNFWLIGFLGLMNKPLGVLSTILPTILFIVGMSDVVHFLSKFLEGIRNGFPHKASIKMAFKEIGMATLLTTLTTAIGFITLLTSSTLPVREFGIEASIGVLIAYVLTFTLLPIFLIWRKNAFIDPKKPYKGNFFWEKNLRVLFVYCIKNSKKILISTLVLILVCIWGISLISQNNFLLDDIKENHPIKKEFSFFDKHFSGIRPFELSVEFSAPLSPANIEQLAILEKASIYLKKEYGLQTVFSLATVLKSINKGLHGGSQEYYIFPESAQDQKKTLKYLNTFIQSGQLKDLISKDQTQLRITGRAGDWGSQVFRKKNEDFYHFVENNFPSDIEWHITGTAHLLDRSNQYLSHTLLQGLGLAFLVIATLMGLLFKSLRMLVISLIPNIIPLLMIAAIMGFFHIELKVTTSIIFTIIFGIAVDDTIHFMSKLKLEKEKGKNLLYALKRTYLSTGRAIIITTLILSGGFLTLVLSDFMGTFYLGLLVSCALVFAVIADLLLLPPLLLYFNKKV